MIWVALKCNFFILFTRLGCCFSMLG